MKVSELIAQLAKAPQDADVVISSYNDGWDDGDVVEITGGVLTDDGLKLCERGGCPDGIVVKHCSTCGLGGRTVWLVKTNDGPKWIENDELRGPHDTQNRYEFVNDYAGGLKNMNIPVDAPLSAV